MSLKAELDARFATYLHTSILCGRILRYVT